jgi:preprotein translocase subunit SecG
MGPLQNAIFIVWCISLVMMITLILMHSGKGGAFSDNMAASLANSRVTSVVLEKNLNIWTNIAIVIWIASIVACIWFFPQGTVGY